MQAKTLRVISGALVLALAGGGYVAYRTVRPKTAAIVARTTTASVGQVTETISASGSVQAADAVNVNAPATATFTELPVSLGDSVTKGQTIAQLDSTSAHNQLETAKANLLSAEAKLQQSLAGLTSQERTQLSVSGEQASAQVKSAARSLNDARSNSALTAKSYAMTVDTAGAALDAAVKTSELNAVNYKAAIDTAQASLDNAKAGAALNEKTYQTTIDSAQASLDNAKKTAEINARSYQNSVDQAQAAIDNARTNAGFSAASSTNAVNQAAATLSGEIATLGAYQQDLTDKQNAHPGDPNHPEVVAAQAKVAAESRAVANAQNALLNQQTNAAGSAAKDSQTIKSAEQSSLNNALTSQTLGLAKDQQSVASAEISLKNANTSKEAGLAKDAQAIAAAETSLRNAVASQTSALLKDAQSVTQAQNTVRNALASETAGLLKDRQSAASAQASLASAQLSLRSTQIANSLKLAPTKAADLLTLQSQVASAKVAVTAAETALAETTIVAPVAGAITTFNARVGDSPGQGAFAVITAVDQLEVKVGFSEANAAKVKAGQRGVISFDALPTVAVSSVVESVDLVATSVQNVATYYLVLRVPGGASQGVKPGMTASVEIIVNEATNAVVVPASAISTFGGRKSVTIRKGVVDTRSVVETGIIGSQGTEVISGVAEGDVLVLPSASATATAGRIASVISGAGGGVATPGGGGPPPGGG